MPAGRQIDDESHYTDVFNGPEDFYFIEDHASPRRRTRSDFGAQLHETSHDYEAESTRPRQRRNSLSPRFCPDDECHRPNHAQEGTVDSQRIIVARSSYPSMTLDQESQHAS